MVLGHKTSSLPIMTDQEAMADNNNNARDRTLVDNANDVSLSFFKNPMKKSRRIIQNIPKNCRNFRRFIFNPATGEIMSRTPNSWLLIAIFYFIFYFFLAVFWAICFVVFMYTQIDDHVPKWQNSGGIIGSSPSLGFRPYTYQYDYPSSTIEINLDSQDMTDELGWQKWANRTSEFLKKYKDSIIDLDNLQSCNVYPYGFDTGTPCIYLKLNLIYGLKSIPYNTSSLPEYVPENIKKLIKDSSDTDKIWINCEETGGPKYLKMIDHFPHAISNSKYLIASNNRTIPNPLIAIKLNPKVKGSETPLIQIQCRAWAENIKYDPLLEKQGLLTLEFKVTSSDKTNVPLIEEQ